jgi:hypothetical protein
MTQHCLYRGPIPCLMVGPWSGTRIRPTHTAPSDVMQGRAWHPQWRRVQYRTLNSTTWPETYIYFVIISPIGKAMSLFKHSCNISAWDVKCDGICISGLAFVRGTLLILLLVVYRDVTRQAKRLYRLKHVGARKSGLAYLSRCNSSWFCHSWYQS